MFARNGSGRGARNELREDGAAPVQVMINEDRNGTRTVLAVNGEIDIATAPTLRQRIQDAVDDGVRLVAVDLTEVGFMDSTGLGVLIGGLKRLRQLEGNLVVVSPSDSVRKIFEVTGLVDVFGVVD